MKGCRQGVTALELVDTIATRPRCMGHPKTGSLALPLPPEAIANTATGLPEPKFDAMNSSTNLTGIRAHLLILTTSISRLPIRARPDSKLLISFVNSQQTFLLRRLWWACRCDLLDLA